MAIISSYTVKGQVSGVEGSGLFEYSLVPSIGNTDLRSYYVDMGMDLKIRANTIGLGVSYRDYKFSFLHTGLGFDESVFEKLHEIRATINYTRAFDGGWSVNISIAPTLASNFESGIGSEDFLWNGSSAVIKQWKVAQGISKIKLGVEYGTLFGRQHFYPILSLMGKLGDHWSFALGVPETWVGLGFNERHSFRARGALFGIYMNNSQETGYLGYVEMSSTKLSFNGTDVGLEHNYEMGTGFMTRVRAGFLFTDNLEVLDPGNRLIYDFRPNASAYITMGLLYKLN